MYVPALLCPGTGALHPLFAAGLLLAGAASTLADVHYVDVNSTNATPPYRKLGHRRTNIQVARITASPAFVTLATGIERQADARTFVDSNAGGAGPYY